MISNTAVVTIFIRLDLVEQDIKIFDRVQNYTILLAFAEKFSNVTNISCDKENATEWEAEFKMIGKEYSVNFDNNGNWKETEY